jgi:hypothetical protein
MDDLLSLGYSERAFGALVWARTRSFSTPWTPNTLEFLQDPLEWRHSHSRRKQLFYQFCGFGIRSGSRWGLRDEVHAVCLFVVEQVGRLGGDVEKGWRVWEEDDCGRVDSVSSWLILPEPFGVVGKGKPWVLQRRFCSLTR